MMVFFGVMVMGAKSPMSCGLFSQFDPSTIESHFFSLKWFSGGLSLLLWWRVFPIHLANVLEKSFLVMFKSMASGLPRKKEVFPFLWVVFFTILVWNLSSLVPFSFGMTTHLSVTFSLALSMWLGGVIFSMKTTWEKFISHLVPLGSPLALAPFLVLIESVSMVMRPVALGLRLMANMVAGHLILSLLLGGGALLTPISMFFGSFFLFFEMCVGVVQAYVFMALISLYWKE
nr:ATP synthase F0 subunit 6 [Saemundssonia lari]